MLPIARVALCRNNCAAGNSAAFRCDPVVKLTAPMDVRPLRFNETLSGGGLLTLHHSPITISFFPQCGCSSMVERQLPKLDTRVRFPSPAKLLIFSYLR